MATDQPRKADPELPIEIPPGDLGLGLCYGCVKTLLIEMRDDTPPGKRTRPRWAITTAPGPFHPPGAPVGVVELVAVPSCLQCLVIGKPGDGQGDDGRPVPPPPQQFGRPYLTAEAPPPGRLVRP